MRTERLYLCDIIEAADAIGQFADAVTKNQFLDNDLLRSGILQKLTIIGEAAARIPASFRKRHPEIEWPDIIAFRNIAVHAYFAVDWKLVWMTAQDDVPQLRRQVQAILDSLPNP